MAKITFNVKVNDLHFQYQLRVPHGACLVQIWRFQLKSVTSYRADKAKFTDRRTDAGNDNTPSVKGWKTLQQLPSLREHPWSQQSPVYLPS